MEIDRIPSEYPNALWTAENLDVRLFNRIYTSLCLQHTSVSTFYDDSAPCIDRVK